MMIYQQDTFTLDTERITDEKHPTFGDMTIFHDVVIASEIVQPYDDGKAWKPRDELEAYAWTVDGRWVIVGSHPSDGIISERDQVSGRTVNPRYVKDLIDPATKRPCRAGVRADVQIFNDKVAPQLLKDMRNGIKKDVSIGFFFNKDEVSGVVESDSCKGQEYDYIQRNMFHDHLAAGIDNGRCPSPYCGLGADEIKRQVTGDPFAGFKDFNDCVSKVMAKNSKLSKESAEKICGKLKSEHEDTLMEDTVLGKSKEHLLLLLEEAYEELRGTVLSKKEHAEGDWWRRVNWATATDETDALIFNNLSDELKTLIVEAGLCPDCTADDESLPYEDGEPLEFELVPVLDKEEEEEEEAEEEESEEEEEKPKKKKDSVDPYAALKRFNDLTKFG